MDTSSLTILVAGANGQLGKCLQDAAGAYPHLRFVFLGREHFALDQYPMVHHVLQALQPQWVINAAAYTAVDKAEAEPELANLMNGEAVGHLAEACQQYGCRLLHVSTDYVFDGQGTTPYHEEDATHPLGVYGRSKRLGEELVMQHAPQSVIVRTSWVYSQHGHNFVKTMLRLMKEKPAINVVNDQWGNPTYAPDLAELLIAICQQPHAPAGIYHFSNSGPITWYQFAEAIQQITGLPCAVHAIPTSAYPTPAKRPAWSVLDNSKVIRTFGIPQRHWKTSLQQCLQLLT